MLFWNFWRKDRPGTDCSLGGRILPERDHSRIIWGGTKDKPWPNYLSRGCPKCGQMPLPLKAVPELPPTQEQVRVRLDEHVIPERVVGRVREFSKGEING